ncbi:hypothetical protein F4778DRAFT_90881 [Xylariomycetidae sp. FL2044]|nr:hypothetical protein F4778DRAFT_90881 [Xylariomycetidae sp. FL2044]
MESHPEGPEHWAHLHFTNNADINQYEKETYGTHPAAYETYPAAYETHPVAYQAHPAGEPVVLHRSKLSTAADVLYILLPLYFIGLAIAANVLQGTPASQDGDHVQEALLLAPTLFPVVFAAVCGHMLKSLALYKSQQGLQLRLLEHLAGAQSLFGALERAFLLRSFGTIGIATTLLWFLSPIGGQALLRLLGTEPVTVQQPYDLSYLGPNFLNVSMFDGVSSSASTLSLVTTLYLSTLLTPSSIRESPRDVWGNPKLPYTGSLNGELREDNWTSVRAEDGYSNLIGIPIGKLVDSTSSQFTITASYLNTSCSALELTTVDDFVKQLKEPLFAGQAGGGTSENGTTTVTFHRGTLQTGMASTFLYMTNSSFAKFQQDASSPLTIFYGSRSNESAPGSDSDSGISISLATCTLVPSTLAMNLTCSGQSCEATAIRRVPYEATGATTSVIRGAVSNGYFCGMGASLHVAESGLTELFITNPDAVIGGGSAKYLPADLWKLPLADFEFRFSQAFNAFYYASTSDLFTTGVDSASNTTDAGYVLKTTGEMTSSLGLQYVRNKAWLAVALIISLVLELVAITNLILRWRTSVPEQFGYVSSLTISNPYCAQQGLVASAATNGMERARRFGDVKFRMADIRPDGDAGQVAFIPMTGIESWGDYSTGSPGAVRFGRPYY